MFQDKQSFNLQEMLTCEKVGLHIFNILQKQILWFFYSPRTTTCL